MEIILLLIVNLISSIAVYVLLYKSLNSKIVKIEQENYKDKIMFNKAVDSFNITVAEFKTVSKDITAIKTDITEIKNKI